MLRSLTGLSGLVPLLNALKASGLPSALGGVCGTSVRSESHCGGPAGRGCACAQCAAAWTRSLHSTAACSSDAGSSSASSSGPSSSSNDPSSSDPTSIGASTGASGSDGADAGSAAALGSRRTTWDPVTGYLTTTLSGHPARETLKIRLREEGPGPAAADAAAPAQGDAQTVDSAGAAVDPYSVSRTLATGGGDGDAGDGAGGAGAEGVLGVGRVALGAEEQRTLSKLVGCLTKEGKRSRAQRVLSDALHVINAQLRKSAAAAGGGGGGGGGGATATGSKGG